MSKKIEYTPGDKIFAKVRGYPHWPARKTGEEEAVLQDVAASDDDVERDIEESEHSMDEDKPLVIDETSKSVKKASSSTKAKNKRRPSQNKKTETKQPRSAKKPLRKYVEEDHELPGDKNDCEEECIPDRKSLKRRKKRKSDSKKDFSMGGAKRKRSTKATKKSVSDSSSSPDTDASVDRGGEIVKTKAKRKGKKKVKSEDEMSEEKPKKKVVKKQDTSKVKKRKSSQPVKSDEISRDDIDLVTRNAASKWRDLARKLPLASTVAECEQEIMQIENAHPGDLKEQCNAMLLKWSTESTVATVGLLVQCLQWIGQEILAHRIVTMEEEKSKERIIDDKIATQLRRHYKSNMSRIQRLPWDENDNVAIREIFVNLSLLKEGSKPYSGGGTLIKELDHLFQNDESSCSATQTTTATDNPRRIAVTAKAGLGKTTCVYKLAFEWASENAKDFPLLCKYQNVFVVSLRYLDENKSLAAILFDQIPSLSEVTSISELETYLKENQSNSLLILDGFDEYNELSCDINNIIDGNMYSHISLLVTSRPWKADKLQDRKLFNKHFQINGFTWENIEIFIKKFFSADIEKANSLFKFLGSRNMLGFAEVPLILLLICLLREDSFKNNSEFPEALTQLYQELTNFIFERAGLEQNDTTILTLGQIAYDALVSEKQTLVFDKDKLLEQFENDTSPFTTGLLSHSRIQQGLHVKHLVSFLHKTHQEYFAAVYLCKQIEEKGEAAMTDFKSMEIMYELEYVLRFTCGMSSRAAEVILTHVSQIHIPNYYHTLSSLAKGEGKLKSFCLFCIKEVKSVNKISINCENSEWSGIKIVQFIKCIRRDDPINVSLPDMPNVKHVHIVNLRPKSDLLYIRSLTHNSITFLLIDIPDSGKNGYDFGSFLDTHLSSLPNLVTLYVFQFECGLSVSLCPKCQPCTSYVRHLRHLPSLTTLRLSDGILNTAGVNELADIMNTPCLPDLELLVVSGNRDISIKAWTCLYQSLSRCTRLQHLDLSWTLSFANRDDTPDVAITALRTSLQCLPSLQVLDFSDNLLGLCSKEATTSLLRTFSGLTSLTSLNLGMNDLSDDMGPVLTEVLPQLHNIQKIELSCNEFTDVTGEHLIKVLPQLHNIQTILLIDNKFTDVTGEHLIKVLPQLHNIQEIYLFGNKFTDAMISKLKCTLFCHL